MRKNCILLAMQLYLISLFGNPIIESQAYISEIFFDANNNWTIEIYFFYHNGEFPDFTLYTSSGSAELSIYCGGIVLINAMDLSTPLPINRTGDFVYMTGDLNTLCDSVIWGNYPGSQVQAPVAGESLVNVVIENKGYYLDNVYWLVKDSGPSPGYINEPVRGAFSGTLVDNASVPITHLEIGYGASGNLPGIWTNENGYFITESMYCKNYTITTGSNSILEDTLTIHIGTPEYRNYQYEGPGKVNVDGYCYLQNVGEHNGSVVYLRKNCPVWVIDSAITDNNGHFNLEMNIR